MHHHGEALRKLKKNNIADWILNKQLHYLSDQDRAILLYAYKLTTDPGSVEETDIETLRDTGLEDRAILDVCQLTAYFNFVNRMAEGLGVQLEK
ncbi:hypothetical protein [Acanthopleuribacter pedis]|uniref:Peroxidase n=1 Tax=Acanthopleuribacter pedis TaxID=442870 RepID=A0A8J7U6I6_9BACT|nr:hypothetical protein [Acanthopleuribacter pedis]MBO1321493.1 hypothetical protein [Acanthopleuribacter pedis]